MREEREKKDKAYEFEAADVAELELVEATCIPALQSGLAILSARSQQQSKSSSSAPVRLPVLCEQLLAARHPHDGRSLLLLAAGAGLGSLTKYVVTRWYRAPEAWRLRTRMGGPPRQHQQMSLSQSCASSRAKLPSSA